MNESIENFDWRKSEVVEKMREQIASLRNDELKLEAALRKAQAEKTVAVSKLESVETELLLDGATHADVKAAKAAVTKAEELHQRVTTALHEKETAIERTQRALEMAIEQAKVDARKQISLQYTAAAEQLWVKMYDFVLGMDETSAIKAIGTQLIPGEASVFRNPGDDPHDPMRNFTRKKLEQNLLASATALRSFMSAQPGMFEREVA